MATMMGRLRASVLGLLQPMPRVSPFKEAGGSGTAIFGGVVMTKERSRKLFGQERYRTAADMIGNISIVAAGVRYFLNLIAKPKWNVDPANDTAEAKKYAEFVEECMNNMDTPWPRIIRRAGMYRFHGFGIHEWTAKRRDDGQIGIQDVESRPQHTIERWETDLQGVVQGVWQRLPQTGQYVGLPRSKIIYLLDDTITDSPEGLGWFRHLVEPGERMEKYLRLEGYGFERDLAGTPIGRAPLEKIRQMQLLGQLDDATAAELIQGITDFVRMQAKRPDTGIILDSAAYTSTTADGQTISSIPQWGIELMTGGIVNLDKVDRAIVRLTHEMARIIGVEGLLVGSDGVGSLALSKDKSNNLYLLVDSTLGDMAAAFSKDYVDPIWKLNGFPDDLKPKLKTEAIAFKDVEQITASLRDMATAGAVLEPDDPAIDDVRELMGISKQPEMTPERMGIIADRNAALMPAPLATANGAVPPGQEEEQPEEEIKPNGSKPVKKKRKQFTLALKEVSE
jgi:hypothetical protein